MNPISKQFAALATRWKRDQFFRAEITLTLWYSLGVIVLLVLFSVGTLQLFSRSIPEIEHVQESQEHREAFTEELFEGEIVEHLQEILVRIDIFLSILVVVLCYFLARRTIAPLRAGAQRQKRFVADVAHEFRTPLSILRAGAEVALRKNDIASYQKTLAQHIEEVDELGTLLDDLLVLVKNEQTQPASATVVDLSTLLTHQIDLFTPLVEKAGLSLDTDIQKDIRIHGYAPDIQRLVINLIKNAVDYNRERGTIFVGLTQGDKQTRLIVRDTGIGIGEHDLPHVFERFYKADTAREKKDSRGAGLGLSLVAEIVSHSGGTIDVESEVGVGTQFTIVFPTL
jgi:two-component system sensor histidine kinase CiaH